MPPTPARAVRFDRYGGTDVLYLTDVEIPEPAEGEAVVAVRAAGINPGEAKIREGLLHAMWPSTFPSGEGSDLAGLVTQVGPGVVDLAVGDEVLGWTDGRASHATHVLVPAAQLIPKPAGLAWEVAGSLFVAGATAWAEVESIGANPGEVVAVSAAAGGVGAIAVQLLARNGVTVLGIASEANAAWLRDHGAVPIAYGPGIADRLRAAAGEEGVAAFLDNYGPDYVDLAVSLGIPTARINTIIAFDKVGELGITANGNSLGARPEVLTELARLAATGELEVPIAATYPLEEVAAAYTELEGGHTRGKIVLIP